jgi:hypothetical protein
VSGHELAGFGPSLSMAVAPRENEEAWLLCRRNSGDFSRVFWKEEDTASVAVEMCLH